MINTLGIGLSIAKILLNSSPNNKLVAIARSKDSLESLLKEFGEDRVGIVVGDVCNPETSTKSINLAIEKFGQVNSIIANAGVLDPVAHVSEADIGKWKKHFDINFFSVVDLIAKAIPELRKSHGNIIAVLSGASVSAYDAWGAYCSSKAALNQYITSVAAEEPSISAISIAPGVVDTSMQNDIRDNFGKNMTPEALKRFKDLHENKELLHPDVPATVYANLSTKGWSKELNGKYWRFNDEKLKQYSS